MILDARWKALPNGNYVLEKFICDTLEKDEFGYTVVNKNGSWEPVTDANGNVIQFKS